MRLARALLPTLLLLAWSAPAVAGEDGPGCLLRSGETVATSAHVFGGLPRVLKPRAAYTCLENAGYAVGYSEARRDPVWAAYHVPWTDHPSHCKRPARFKVDPRTQARVDHDAYTQHGGGGLYDRGHMAPRWAVGSRHGCEAQDETFTMSNVAPQRKVLNEQAWRSLEHIIAWDWSKRYGDVWVVSGPIFAGRPARLNGVSAIPAAFYSIVVARDGDDVRLLAVVLRQGVTGKPALKAFVTTVADVQRRTGLDFFPDLPADVQARLEARKADADWDLEQLLSAPPGGREE